MELKYKGDVNNEFYDHSIDEKMHLFDNDFQWTNSRNISAFKYIENDLILRLHNGSMYLFEGQKDWGVKNLSTTIRRDVIGLLIRKKKPYYFVGLFGLENDSNETDNELLYYYVNQDKLQKTKEMSVYKNEIHEEIIVFYGPNDRSIINYHFHLVCKTKTIIFDLGSIFVLDVIENDAAKWSKLKLILDSDTLNAIKYMRRQYGDKVEIIFTNPHK